MMYVANYRLRYLSSHRSRAFTLAWFVARYNRGLQRFVTALSINQLTS